MVLQATGQAGAGLFAQGANGFEAQGGVAGEDDDAVLVADIRLQARAGPALFNGFEAHLDHRHADDFVALAQAVGQVITGLAGGAADAEEASRLTLHGILVIGTKGQVLTLEAVGIAPVAGGLHPAAEIKQIDRPAAAAPVEAFEVAIDLEAPGFAGVEQQLADAGLQLQQAGQVGVGADFAFQRAGM